MEHGWWIGEKWVTSAGLLIPSRKQTRARLRNKRRTLLVVGDSTMRFLYSAILDTFDINRLYPHHRMPVTDACAFEKIGWPTSGACATRWRGPCKDNNHGCSYLHKWSRLRLIFTWWRNNLPLTLPHRKPDLLLTSTGVWEAMGIRNLSRYRKTVRRNVRKVISATSPRRTIIFSNGICLGAQRVFHPETLNMSLWITPNVERRILIGNLELAAVALEDSVLFIDRIPSMITGNDTNSPCIMHHPYGKASELHATLALMHL